MSELTKRIRAKYPGAYDDLDDATLEKQILAKFPEYADLAQPQGAMSTEQLQAANLRDRSDLPSTTGFLKNLASSAGDFALNTAKGIGAMGYGAGKLLQAQFDPRVAADIARGTGQAIRNAPAIGGALLQGAKARYGGVDPILHTAYTDPVGMASDVSMVALPAAGAAKLSGLPKLAGALSKVEQVTNPLNIAGRLAEPALHGTGKAIVSASLRPAKHLREDFGGRGKIAESVLKHGVSSEAGAARKLDTSYGDVDALLAAREAGGTPGISPQQLVHALGDEPARTARLDVKLGDAATPNIPQRQERILEAFTTPASRGTQTVQRGEEIPDAVDAAVRAVSELGPGRTKRIPPQVFGGDNPAAVAAVQQIGPQAHLVPRRLLGESQTPTTNYVFGEHPPTPAQLRDIPLTEAQSLKRRAQERAYEFGKKNESLSAIQERELAKSLRSGIEQRVPEVGPMNQRSQELLAAKLALGEAEDRPRTLTNIASLLGGTVGLSSFGPKGAALGLAMRALDSPRAGALTGISLDRFGRGLNSQAMKRALLARLLAQREQENAKTQ